jgi:hypothetical protein
MNGAKLIQNNILIMYRFVVIGKIFEKMNTGHYRILPLLLLEDVSSPRNPDV